MSNHDYALPSGLPHAYDSRQYSTNSGAKIMYGSPQIMPYQLSPTLNTGTLGGNGHSGQHEDSQLPYDQDWNNTGSSASSPNRQSSTNNVSSAPPTNAGGQKKASSRNRSAMACLLCRKQKMKCEGQDKAPCKRCRAAKVVCTFEPSAPAPPTSRARPAVTKEWVDSRMFNIEGRLTQLEKRGSFSSSADTGPDVSSPPTPTSSSATAALEARLAHLEAQVYALSLAAAAASNTPLSSHSPALPGSATIPLYPHQSNSQLQPPQHPGPNAYGFNGSAAETIYGSPQLGSLPNLAQQQQQHYGSNAPLRQSTYPPQTMPEQLLHQQPQSRSGSAFYGGDMHGNPALSSSVLYGAPGQGPTIYSHGGPPRSAGGTQTQQQQGPSSRPPSVQGSQDSLGRLHPFAGGGSGRGLEGSVSNAPGNGHRDQDGMLGGHDPSISYA